MNNATSVKMRWELFPREMQEIARKERIFNVPVVATMSSVLTNTLYMRFIAMAKRAAENPDAYPPATEEQIETAKSYVIFAATAQAGEDRELLEANLNYVELTWPAYRAKMLASPAFAKWVVDGGVIYSFYLYCFYIDVDGFLGFDEELRKEIKPQTTFQMDTAYGEYRDVLGNLREIPRTDPAFWHCYNSSLWRDVANRGVFAKFYLCEAGEGALVVDLCSGALNLERRFGYLDEGLNQRVIGYEIDPNAAEVAARLIGKPLEERGFEIRCEDFFNAFSDPELIGNVDFLMMNGGMSYNVPRTVEILRGARGLLKVSKRFVFNIEIATTDMAHALYVLGLKNQHESLMPDSDLKTGIARIEAAIKESGGFEIECIRTDEGLYGEDAGIAPTFAQFVLRAV